MNTPVAATEPLTDAQRLTLELFRSRTAPGRWYRADQVFPDDPRRRVGLYFLSTAGHVALRYTGGLRHYAHKE